MRPEDSIGHKSPTWRRSALRFSAVCALSLLISGSAAAKTIQLVYFEAGDYPFHRALQREYRAALDELAPEAMDVFFPANGYKSAEWDRAECKRLAREISADRSFDLVVAMGPWVVEDLLEAGCKKPIVALGRFDPVLEGLADQQGRPVRRNLTVRLRPEKVATDFAALQAVYPEVKTVGVLYFPMGQEWDLVEKFLSQRASERDLELVAIPPDPSDPNYKFFRKLPDLKDRVDVLYLTPLFGLNLEQISGFLQQAKVMELPVFSSEGYYQVERGAFASNSGYTTTGAALYHARKTIKILEGARPQELPTVFREGRRLSINLQACRDHNIVTPEHFLADARVLEPPVSPGAPVYTIASALAEAERLNPGLLADQESAAASRSRVAEVRAAYYPHLTAEAYVRSYDRDPPVNALRRYPEGRSGYDVTLSQKILDYPLLKRMSAAADRADRADSDLQSSRIEFDYTLSELYLTLVLALARRDALDEYRERVHRGLQGALALYQMEELERVELLRWESRKDEASEALVAARGELSELEVEFLAALGRPFREEFTVDRGLYALTEFKWAGPENPVLGGIGARGAAEEFWVAEALLVRPQSAGIAASLAAKEAELSAARTWYVPSLSAEAGYFKDNQFETGAPLTVYEDGWFVGARLSAALFDGAQSLKRSARLRAEVSELEYRRDQNSLEIATAARRAFSRLASSYDRTLFAWRSQKMAADALEALFSEYERGRLNFGEVSEALDRALESELDALRSSYDYFVALMQLWRVTGYGYVEENSALQRDLYERLRSFVAAQR